MALAILLVSFWNAPPAFAYIVRTGNPPGTDGAIIPNGQITAGTEFRIQSTTDPELESIQ